MTTFPTLRLGVLQSMIELQAQFHHNPQLFDEKECPYDRETVDVLRRIFAVKTIEKEVVREVIKEVGRTPVAEKLNSAQQEEVEQTALDLLQELKKLGNGEKGLDTSTKIQIIKTKATLIEQLLKMRERFMNVKRVANFQTVVIAILDDLLDEDRRQEFLKRVEPFRE